MSKSTVLGVVLLLVAGICVVVALQVAPVVAAVMGIAGLSIAGACCIFYESPRFRRHVDDWTEEHLN